MNRPAILAFRPAPDSAAGLGYADFGFPDGAVFRDGLITAGTLRQDEARVLFRSKGQWIAFRSKFRRSGDWHEARRRILIEARDLERSNQCLA